MKMVPRRGGRERPLFSQPHLPSPSQPQPDPPAPRIWAAGEGGGGLGIPVLSQPGVWGYTIIPYVMENLFMLFGVWFGFWGSTRRRVPITNAPPSPLLELCWSSAGGCSAGGPLFWPPWRGGFLFRRPHRRVWFIRTRFILILLGERER